MSVANGAELRFELAYELDKKPHKFPKHFDMGQATKGSIKRMQ